MHIKDHVGIAAAIPPNELEMLQRVFNRVCERRGMTSDHAAAKIVAGRLISLFQHGIRSERQLLTMLSGTGSYP